MTQEKKNLRRLILLVALASAAATLLFIQRDERSPDVDATLFRPGELDKIDRIELLGTDTVNLAFDGTGWKVNDRFPADRQRITVLFATIDKAVPKRPVSAGQQDSIRTGLQQRGVRVKLFAGTDVKMEFYAGGNGKKTESYFTKGGNDDVYLVHIPGYRVYVSQIFELDENEWRDKRIFGFRWENFRSLSMTYAGEPTSGFRIEKDGGEYRVKDMPRADTSRLFTFLDDVSLLIADRILPAGTRQAYDSLSRSAPMAVVDIDDIAGRTYFLRLFRPLEGENLLLGVTSSGEMVLIDRSRLFRILKKRSYFVAVPG